MPVYAFGSNSNGQLGTGNKEDAHKQSQSIVPQSFLDSTPRVLTGGANHSLVVSADGRIFTCGRNDKGQLGIEGPGRESFCEVVLDSSVLIDICEASCGWDHSLILSSDGVVYGFGCNEFGQLGLGQINCVNRPYTVPVPGPVRKCAAGLRHSVLLLSDGSVWGMGLERFGQLGLLPTGPADGATSTYKPLRLPLPPCQDIAAGEHHTLGLTRSGTIIGMGRNRHGQLLPTTPSKEIRVPVEVRSADEQQGPLWQIACGWSFSVCISVNGQLDMWGRDDHHQTAGSSLSEVQQVTCGSEHSLCLTSAGACLAWGWNEHGNCGVGHCDDVTSPQTIVSSGVTKIGCGYGHSLLYISPSQIKTAGMHN
ncbi:regulator of chromosome condensation 1/beta-lactamase-inhibitor protein II [Phlyctochytrium arcticum]|nr:regulator of chromosome condensation 1/beta-lactamase-inhibitor protein II [Phlyctochytrium arcticum]